MNKGRPLETRAASSLTGCFPAPPHFRPITSKAWHKMQALAHVLMIAAGGLAGAVSHKVLRPRFLHQVYRQRRRAIFVENEHRRLPSG